MKICMLGLGYIGLPTAGMLATHGHQVVGVDINHRVVDALSSGEVHIHEPGLKTLVQAGLNSGKFVVTHKPEVADVFIIAVPTPLEVVQDKPFEARSRPSADLSFVTAAAKAIVPYLRPNNLVILESTVPPRTTVDVLVPILEKSGFLASKFECADQAHLEPSLRSPSQTEIFYVAHCPERVLPGKILEELIHNDRVIGGVCPVSAQRAKTFYTSFVEGDTWLTDATTAELVKLMENTYRDVNIALANELALVAEKVGTNVWESIGLANRHPRVQILEPGPGVGGHCIAVDPWFIAQVASDVTPLIQTARQVNDDMPQHVVNLLKEALVKLPGDVNRNNEKQSTVIVACLGLAYKGDVDDARESPAIKVVALLKEEGFKVRAFDSYVKFGAVPEQVSSLEEAVNGADVIIVLTGHTEFRTLKPDKLPGFKGQVVIDTRHILPTEEWTNEGRILLRTGSMKPNHLVKAN